MFFLGIGPKNSDKCTDVIVLDMFLKNIKRHYRITEIRSIPFLMTDPDITQHIKRIFEDSAFIVNKRIFSQDRRPTKNIRANPKLVIHGDFGGEHRVTELRALRIPVECVLPVRSAGWEKIPHGRALGDDYHVGLFDLMENMIRLYCQNRLLFEVEAQENKFQWASQLEGLKTAYEDQPDASNPLFSTIEPDHPLILLSLPLWFRERVPYSRPYKA